MLWFTVFVGFLYLVSGFSFTRPGLKCDAKDFNCLGDIVRKFFEIALPGIEEICVVCLDPLQHEVLEIKEPDFECTLKDSNIVGFKDSFLNGITITKENHTPKIHFDFTMPHYQMSGNYKIDGKLNNMPITGDGKYNFKATNISVLAHAAKGYYLKDGKLHMKLKDFLVETKVLDTPHFDADNLFGGNKEKSDQALKFINDNASDMMKLFEKNIITANIDVLFENYNKILEYVPLDEIVVHETIPLDIIVQEK